MINEPIRIAVFGCKSTTAFLVDYLHQVSPIRLVVTLSREQAEGASVADYCDVESICTKRGITCYRAHQYSLKNGDDVQAIAEMDLDIGFVIGWQRLIPYDVLGRFSVGVFGMHGSSDDLPIGRGRSPMNWALIERRRHFCTNLFRYDPGVDSGDIVDTLAFGIQPSDTAETMHYKNLLAMKCLISRNMAAFRNRTVRLRPQKDREPTYYPKRNPEDSIIDWRQDIFQIEAHIRAVTTPFNGAFTFLGNNKLIIYRASLFETDVVDFGYTDRVIGEIVEVFPSGKFLVRCRGGLLIVHEYESSVRPRASSLLESPVRMIKLFPRNEFGYFDMRSTEQSDAGDAKEPRH